MVEKSVLALDISDHSIEALVLAKPWLGKPKVVSYARTVLRGKVVSDGAVLNPEKLVEALLALLKSGRPKAIKNTYCLLSLPDSQVFTTIFKLPSGLKREEIKNTIPFKAEEVIPFKSSEIYFDFKPIAVHNGTQEIFYAAVPIKIVDGYVDILRRVGLKPVAFDLESISSARALFDFNKKNENAKLVMDIGARTTDMNIFDANGIRQGITVKIAGDRFTKAIVTNMKVTPKAADDLKIKHGFNPDSQQGKILFIIQNEFNKVIAEAKKLIDYYQSHYQKKIDEVILVGGSALLPNIDQYLADNLEITVNRGQPLLKVDDHENILNVKDKVVLFTNVIGLALRGLSKDPVGSDINLLPLSSQRFALMPRREEKKAWKQIYISLAVMAGLLVVLGGIYMMRRQGQDLYQRFFAPPKVETNFNGNINVEILDQLRGGWEMPTSTLATTTPPTATSTVATTTPVTTLTPVVTSTPPVTAPAALFKVKIRPTSLGYVNVRSGAGISFPKIDQVNPGTIYEVVKQQNDWYQIKLGGEKTGWVISTYVDKLP